MARIFRLVACEAAQGSVAVAKATRIDHAAIGCLASVGSSTVPVYRKPRVAIVATGDEIVPVDATPLPDQIRNSNTWQLAAQVERAGGIPLIAPVAKDDTETTRMQIATALETADLLLLTGGVSAGRYDFVEDALALLGAEFFFTRVAMQPGQPVVFGAVQGKLFFGLPGNPVSAMVTFEALARAALDLIAGVDEPAFPVSFARLTAPFRHKPGLTRFVPAILGHGEVTLAEYKGSGDLNSVARSNAFLMVDPDNAEYAAGDLIAVLLK